PWMNDLAAIGGARDLVYAHSIALDRHLGHLDDKAAAVIEERDAARSACWQLRSPPRPFGRDLEHVLQARMLAQHLATKLEWIAPRGVRQLIEEALEHERVLRRAHGPPEPNRHRELRPRVADVHVRYRVRQVGEARDGGAIDAAPAADPLRRNADTERVHAAVRVH